MNLDLDWTISESKDLDSDLKREDLNLGLATLGLDFALIVSHFIITIY